MHRFWSIYLHVCENCNNFLTLTPKLIVLFIFCSIRKLLMKQAHYITKKHLKNVGPIHHCEPPHAHSADVASGTVAHRLRIDVDDNDDNDNNDNA